MPISVHSFYILAALAGGERHGYAIIKDVEEVTGGEETLLPGTLYRLIKQLVTDGWIVEVAGPSDDDPRRRYYRLTPRGRKVAEAEARRLADIVQLARRRRLLAT